MERGNVPIDRWLDQAVSGIRFGPDRAAVRAELEAHMEDKAADLQRIFPDISREEAEDAVQDAVCAAFQGIGALRSVSSFKAWLFSILSNTCKHHIAAVKERRLTTPLEEARRLGESECSEELMLAMELREAIYALSDEERSIVLLSIIGGYKSHEIAKALSCPPGTVRSKLSRSLAKLRLTAEKESS